MRIGARLTLTTSALVAVTLGVYGVIALRTQRSELEEQNEGRARELAGALRISIESSAPADWTTAAADLSGRVREAFLPYRVDVLDAATVPPAGTVPSPSPKIERLRRMVALRTAVVDVTREAGRPTFVYLEPVRLGSRIVGAIEVSRDVAYLDAALTDETLRTVVSMAVLIGLVILAISLSTRNSVSRPIRKLIAGIDDVAKGDLSHVLLAERDDEIGALAARFNDMTQSLRDARAETGRSVEERLALEAHLRDTAQLATIGQLAAEIAHEVGTPLNVVTGRARAILRKNLDDPAAVRKNATIIAEQAARITRIIQRLLDVARRQVGASEKSTVDLNKLAADTLELLEYQLGSGRIEGRTRLEKTLGPIPGNKDQLQQVLLNLYMNAVEAMPDGGELEVRTGRIARRRPGLEVDPERRYAVLEVADTGTGIDEKDRAKIFEAFYTSKAGIGGTGLGLSVAHGIVKDHDGWIELADHAAAGKGTVFRVYLPEEMGGP